MKILVTFSALFFSFAIYSQSYNVMAYTKVNNDINKNRLELKSKIVDKTTLPVLYKFKNEKLILNGAGLKKHSWKELYACGLYLEFPSTDAEEIINANEYMIIRMDILSKAFDNEKMVKAFDNAFLRANGEGTKMNRKDELELFHEFIENIKLKEGDKVDVIFQPQKGLSLHINYKEIGTINSLEFKKTIFRIWLSEKNSIDKNLRKELLNGAQEYLTE